MSDNLIPVVKAMLNDDEFMCGGVFQKRNTMQKNIILP